MHRGIFPVLRLLSGYIAKGNGRLGDPRLSYESTFYRKETTTRCGHVRRLLKSKQARVVCRNPFTIRLLYDCPNAVQPLYVGMDPGRSNIGLAVVREDGTPVLTVHVATRNKDIPKLMAKRKAFRQQHRYYGRRTVRQRRAVQANTVKADTFERVLPGCKEPIVCHYIKNKEARFNNRRRPKGWLTPTARQLLQTHLNLIAKIAKWMPVTAVVVELNRFDFQAMDNPKIQKWQYQHGPLYGKGDVTQAVCDMQDGRCLLCGGDIEQYHHIVPRHLNGSNTYQNMVGLCSKCHSAVHTDAKAAASLHKLKEGLNKQPHALSVPNQIVPHLLDALADRFPGCIYATNGLSTSQCRKANGYEKDHHIDAYCIALSAFPCAKAESVVPAPLPIQQFRRHDRQACIRQMLKRTYYPDGKAIAVNRHKALEQKEPSLSEVRETLTNVEISRLTVKPHKAQYKDMSRPMPGSVFLYNRQLLVLKGSGENIFIATDGQHYNRKLCKIIAYNCGMVALC